MRSLPRRLAGVVVASLLSGWLLPAEAAPADVKPAILAGPLTEVTSGSLAIAAGGRGHRFASWSGATPAGTGVSVAERPPGRSGWTVHRLASGGSPTLALDERGDAAVIWRYSNPHEPEEPGLLDAAVKPEGAAHWSRAQVIARFQPADGLDQEPDIALGGNGEILIVWSEGSEEEPDTPLAEEPGQSIEAVSGSVRSGRFDPPEALSSATDFHGSPRAALDGHGDAVVVWQAGLRGGLLEYAVQAAFRPARSGWGAPIAVARSGVGLADPRVAIDEDGRAVATWERLSPLGVGAGKPSSALESAFGSASAGGWGPAHQLSPPGQPAGRARLAADPTGQLAAAWEADGRTGNSVVATVGSTASGSWGAPSTIATWGHVAPSVCPEGASCPVGAQPPPAAPQVAIDARGDAAIAWEQAGGYRAFIRAARRPVGSRRWLEPVRVSAPGTSEVDVALGGSGGAFLIWQTVGACPAPCQRGGRGTIDVATLGR